MYWEQAQLTRTDAPLDVEAIEAHLESLPWCWRDPVEGRTFYLSAYIRSARYFREKRLSDPARFPYGVLITVVPDCVWIDQCAGAEDLARCHEFVAWLLRSGTWQVKRDYHFPVGPLASADELFSWADLPDPSELIDYPVGNPVLEGIVTSWDLRTWSLSVHSSGAVRLSFQPNLNDRWRYHFTEAQLTPVLTGEWNRISDINLKELKIDYEVDFDGPNTIWLSRETPNPEDEECFSFDETRAPATVRPLRPLVYEWKLVLEAWEPGAPPPPGFVSVRRLVK